MSETDLVRTLIQYLRLRGAFCWRQNQGGMAATYKGKKRFMRFAGVDGISDIIGVLPDGRFLAVEAKVGRNKPTKHQRAFLESVESQGGVAVVARSIEDVERAVTEEAAA